MDFDVHIHREEMKGKESLCNCNALNAHEPAVGAALSPYEKEGGGNVNHKLYS
jgi:hypothetical protein